MVNRLVKAAAAAVLTAGMLGVVPTTAHAVTATKADPTNDVLTATNDITSLTVELDFDTLTVKMETAAPLPQISDPSWSADIADNKRIAFASFGPQYGEGTGILLYGGGVFATSEHGDQGACDDATHNISGTTLTMSAPAKCFSHLGKAEVQGLIANGLDAVEGQVDIAIAGPVTNATTDDDIESVNASLPGGYYLLGGDGGVFSFGDAQFFGSTGNLTLNAPVVAMAAQSANDGYRFVATDGGIFAYGKASFLGSMGGNPLNKPIVGMATTEDGAGYWLVSSDGGIFAYGNAAFHGSLGSVNLNKPIVGMVPTADGGGYLLVASDGGVFAFGNAKFHGSMGALPLNKPIVGLAATPDGGGYRMVASDGGVFAFGTAGFFGSGAGDQFDGNVVGISAIGDGYYLVGANGEVRNYGPAPAYDFGDLSRLGVHLNKPLSGMAVS
jgi:hypothetical protein